MNDLSDVGSYTGSPSPNGTFDQGENVLEWSETRTGEQRVARGGSYISGGNALAAFFRADNFPQTEFGHFGFRVASVLPPPGPVPKLGAAQIGCHPDVIENRTGVGPCVVWPSGFSRSASP